MRTKLLKQSERAPVTPRADVIVDSGFLFPNARFADEYGTFGFEAGLSEREREVLRWTALGKTSDEVATIMGLRTRTVNFHITQILIKLDAKNKTQAAVKALKLHLIHLVWTFEGSSPYSKEH